MARRYRKRYGGGRDLFPTQVAAVALVFVALLGAVVVWGLMPEDDGVGEALAREEADRASFGLPERVPEAPPASAAATTSTREAVADSPQSAAPDGTVERATIAPPEPARSTPPADEPRVVQAPETADERRTAQAAARAREAATTTTDAAYSPQRREPPPRQPTEARQPAESTRTAPASTAPAITLFTATEANAAGEQALAAGNAREAVVHFQRAAALEPEDAAYRTSYATALLRAGDAPTAVRQLEQVVRNNYRLAGVWALLAEARLARGDTAGARFAYGRYIDLERDPRLRADARTRIERLRSNF